MATLANLVKNIDPPVEITQEEYNNLTEEQKNDGTVYYIVDGSSSFQTAATTPAEASDGTGSNVQTELDKRLEISKLVNGGTATEAGYALDARYGKTLADQVSSLNSSMTYKAGDSVQVQTTFTGKATNAKDGYFGAIILPRAVQSGLTITISEVAQYGQWYSDGASHTLTLDSMTDIQTKFNTLWFKIPATNISDSASFVWLRLVATITFS